MDYFFSGIGVICSTVFLLIFSCTLVRRTKCKHEWNYIGLETAFDEAYRDYLYAKESQNCYKCGWTKKVDVLKNPQRSLRPDWF